MYSFDCHRSPTCSEVVSIITETVARMQREGIDIRFLGATQEIDATGELIAVDARYAAPNKGSIGWLNCRACLPASGPPQAEEVDISNPREDQIPVVGR